MTADLQEYGNVSSWGSLFQNKLNKYDSLDNLDVVLFFFFVAFYCGGIDRNSVSADTQNQVTWIQIPVPKNVIRTSLKMMETNLIATMSVVQFTCIALSPPLNADTSA